MNIGLHLFDVRHVVPKYRPAFAVVCQPSLGEDKYHITAYCSWTARSVHCDTRDKRKVAKLFREKGIQTKNADWMYTDEHRIFTHSCVNDWHAFQGWFK